MMPEDEVEGGLAVGRPMDDGLCHSPVILCWE